MYRYNLKPRFNESNEDFQKRIEHSCDGKSVLAINYLSDANNNITECKITAFEELSFDEMEAF